MAHGSMFFHRKVFEVADFDLFKNRWMIGDGSVRAVWDVTRVRWRGICVFCFQMVFYRLDVCFVTHGNNTRGMRLCGQADSIVDFPHSQHSVELYLVAFIIFVRVPRQPGLESFGSGRQRKFSYLQELNAVGSMCQSCLDYTDVFRPPKVAGVSSAGRRFVPCLVFLPGRKKPASSVQNVTLLSFSNIFLALSFVKDAQNQLLGRGFESTIWSFGPWFPATLCLQLYSRKKSPLVVRSLWEALEKTAHSVDQTPRPLQMPSTDDAISLSVHTGEGSLII